MYMKRYSTSFVIIEMQIKATMQYYYTPIRVARIQNTDNTCGREQQGLSCVAGRNAKRAATLENNLVVSYKSKHTLTIQSSNCASWYLPKRVEKLCPHKNLLMDIYSSFIHNCQNLETVKMSFSR